MTKRAGPKSGVFSGITGGPDWGGDAVLVDGDAFVGGEFAVINDGDVEPFVGFDLGFAGDVANIAVTQVDVDSVVVPEVRTHDVEFILF